MKHLTMRLKNLQHRNKQAVVTTTTIVAPLANKMFELRSSSTVNLPVHRTMSISFIASQIQSLSADVRKVAQNIIEMQKFHTLPQLVSREEIDRKVLDDNEALLFLGVRDLPKKKYHDAMSANDRANALKSGSDYLVNGILGPALYAVQAIRDPNAKDNDEEAIMHAYNQALEYSKSDKKKGIVLRMTLKSDARTIAYSDFLKLLAMNNAQINADLQYDMYFSKYLNVFLNTPTLVAIAQGYDAITMIPDGTVVVLNRGALRIQKTNATTRNSMYAQVMVEVEKQEAIEREKKAKEEQKRKEQLRKQRDQEKKLELEERKKRLAVDQPQVAQQKEPVNVVKTTKSANIISFDDDIYRILSNRDDITESEKMEIISFVNQYNSADKETQRALSVQLKEIMS